MIPHKVLTRRIQVAHLIRAGRTYMQMAGALNVSEATITRDVQAVKTFDSILALDHDIADIERQVKDLRELAFAQAATFAEVASLAQLEDAEKKIQANDHRAITEWDRIVLDELEHRRKRNKHL